MSNKKLMVFLMVLVTLLMFAQPTLALSEDFYVTAQKEKIDVCSCGMTATTYFIRNSGAVTSTYQIFKSGSAAQYSTLSESYFTLEPGEAKEIINYLSFPCSATGKYSEIINITTVFGLSKSFVQEIAAGRCANFEILPVESVQSSCPCSPVQYSIYIKNTGSYDEVFDINVTTFPEYAALSERRVLLRPNENKTIVAYFNLPCRIFGETPLSVDIRAQKSQYLAQVPLTLSIRECYDYVLEADSQFTICEGESAVSQIRITNRAEFSNTFVLSTTQKYAKIENNSIFLWPNETGTANIVVDASKLPAKDYSFEIISASQKGEAQRAVFAALAVEKCRDFSFRVEGPDEKIIASKEYKYDVIIENKGTRAGAFKVSVEGPGWLIPEEESTTIASGSTGTVSLDADIPPDFSGNAYARVVVVQDWIEDSQKISIPVMSVEKAYVLGFKVLNKAVRYDFSDINVEVENKGVETTTYALSLEGPAWMALSQNEIELAPGETETISIQTSPNEEVPEGKYAVKLVAALPEAGIGYSTGFNVKLFSAHWHEKAYGIVVPFLAAYWIYILIIAAAIAALVFLIWIARKIARKVRENKKLKKDMAVVKVVEEKKPPATYQPSFQPFVTPTMLHEEAPKFSVPKAVKAKDRFNWARFFRMLFLLLAVAGVVALIALNWGAIYGLLGGLAAPATENQTLEDDKAMFAPEVEIDRSEGIEGEGNVVYVRADGTIEIPVIIKNRAPAKVVYAINSASTSWITADKKFLSLDINETGTLRLLVNTTPELPDGTYQIGLGLSIDEKDLKYSEKIELKIQREKPALAKYLPYILAGIALAALLIIVLALTRRSRFDVKKDKDNLKVTRVRAKGSGRGLLGNAIIFIIMALIAFGTACYVLNLPEAEEEAYDSSLNLSMHKDQTIAIKAGFGEKVIIPFIFSNSFDSGAAYDIKTSADWIEATEGIFTLDAGEVKAVNITAAPKKGVEPGAYFAAIAVDVPDEGVSYVKTVVFDLKDRSLGKTLMNNRFFVIGAAAVVIGLMLLLTFKKRRAEKRQFLAEIRQEIESEKIRRGRASKTEIKVKSRAKKQK